MFGRVIQTIFKNKTKKISKKCPVCIIVCVRLPNCGCKLEEKKNCLCLLLSNYFICDIDHVQLRITFKTMNPINFECGSSHNG